jgi:hypothetical protein
MCKSTLRSPSLAWTTRAAAIVAAGLCAAVAFAAVTRGTVTRDDVIRAEPVATGAAVATVRTGATVSVVDRNGFWRRVEGPAGKGWLRMSSVRVDSAASAGAGLAALATGRGATGNVVTTSGARGISAEDLTGATPDAAELQEVETLAVTPEQARRFAGEAGLAPRELAYLPPPGDQKTSAAGEGGGG